MAKRNKRVEYRNLICGDRKLTGIANVHGMINREVRFTYDYSGNTATLTVSPYPEEDEIDYKRLAHSLKAIAHDLVK